MSDDNVNLAESHSEPPSKKEKKAKQSNLGKPPKKPKLSKAERRALQESQRAAKAAKAGGGGKGAGNTGCGKGGRGSGEKGRESGAEGNWRIDAATKRSQEENTAGADGKRHIRDSEEDKTMSLFSHLPRPSALSEITSSNMDEQSNCNLHPAILTLGRLFQTRTIVGGNARCRAMLQAFALILQTYTPPPNSRDFRHDVDLSLLKPAFQYWTTLCRPHSVSMGNSFSFLKLALANLERDLEWDEARRMLLESIEAYITERIEYAGKAVSRYAGSKVQDRGDVILVFGKSEVINRLLLDAALEDKKIFRVIVVDSRPLLEGRDTLEILSKAGIPCTYVLLNALSYLMMREVTKVFLGASALMSNGSILSRVGTACVALLATDHNIPVLVCCETYKICNRVQLESITGNELGNAYEVTYTHCARSRPSNRLNESKSEVDMLLGWNDQPNLKLLNLRYDLTPSNFVTGIVTEVGILPPSSVAVLLREMSPELAFKSNNA